MKHFQKCGEILVDVKSKDKMNKIYILHCSFCAVKFNQLRKFSLHVENHLKYSEGILKDTEVEVKLEPEEIQIEVKLAREGIQTEEFSAIEGRDVKLEPDAEELVYEPFGAIARTDIKLESNIGLHSEHLTPINIPNIKVEGPLEKIQIDEIIAVERPDLKAFASSVENTTNLYTHLLHTLNTVNDCEVESESSYKHEVQSIICNGEDMESVISISDSDEQVTEGEYFSRGSTGISSTFGSERGDDVEDYSNPLLIPEHYIKNESCAKRKTKHRNTTSAERQRQYRQRLKLDKDRYDAYRLRERDRKRVYRKQFKQRRLYNK